MVSLAMALQEAPVCSPPRPEAAGLRRPEAAGRPHLRVVPAVPLAGPLVAVYPVSPPSTGTAPMPVPSVAPARAGRIASLPHSLMILWPHPRVLVKARSRGAIAMTGTHRNIGLWVCCISLASLGWLALRALMCSACSALVTTGARLVRAMSHPFMAATTSAAGRATKMRCRIRPSCPSRVQRVVYLHPADNAAGPSWSRPRDGNRTVVTSHIECSRPRPGQVPWLRAHVIRSSLRSPHSPPLTPPLAATTAAPATAAPSGPCQHNAFLSIPGGCCKSGDK